MDKLQARDRIQEVFEQPFDKERFMVFIRNLLNRIDETKAFHVRGDVKESFRSVIKTYERIGSYEAPDGKKIDIIIAYLQKSYSIHHARVTQRNFAGKYLSDRNQKDAGLFAFVSPDEEDWRFSLVKMEYKFEQTKDGKTKVKEEYTPARWSFLVGANERSHTAQSRLVNILAEDDKSPTIEQIEEAFNIETVTKEFFREYRDLFIRTKEALDKVIQHDPNIQTDFSSKCVNTVDFAKKLLGQIIFLYFLQKKGWFGVARNAEWGTGSKNFLRELFESKHGTYKNFFNDILEPLFYDALSRDRSDIDHWNDHFKSKIPFLNGGLFDPIGNYNWYNTDILFPNDLFSNQNKTKDGDAGDGILDIFDRYNFTVKEDEPLEKEVAIDPELLGKAYEKFNAIRPDNFEEYKQALKSGNKGDETKFNKQFGVYYTPREIVHYMCQQSLINYLFNKLNSGRVSLEKIGDENFVLFDNKSKKGQLDLIVEHRENPVVLKEDIEKLIHHGENVSENEARVESKGKETSTYYYQLPENIRINAEKIDQKLAEITVCDLAVGSGAFPVGMMNEIVRARTVLTIFIDQKTNRTTYNFKRRCIEHSIYGVDIDLGAVEIAKLRLWLSLVVDEDDIKNIKPLPNLDYKIVCGNSLLGFPEGWGSPIEKEIESLKNDFFSETNPGKKNELKQIIDGKIRERYANSLKNFGYEVNFDFKTVFSEIFQKQGGFDIVVANPPYVRADSPDFKPQRDAIMQSRRYETLYEKWDLFIPFIEQGLKLLSSSGFLSYITSNSLLTSKFAFRLLEYIQHNYATQFIDYFTDDTKVFDAGVVPVVFGVSRQVVSPSVRKTVHHGKFNNVVRQEIIPLIDFRSLGRDAFRLSMNSFKPAIKIISLGDICYLSKGMVVNADEKSAQGEFAKDDLISNSQTPIHSKKYIEGKDITYYVIKRFKYLEWDTERVPKKLSRPTFTQLYDRPKIMRGRVTGGIFDDTGLVSNDSIVIFVRFAELTSIDNKSISGSLKKFNSTPRTELEAISIGFDLKYILSILNSKFANRFLNSIRRHRLENYFYPDDFRKLPIADISVKEQKPFIDFVDNILAITKSGDYLENPAKKEEVKEYEKQIDQMVYKLYGLTEDEIKIVEGKND